MGDCESFSLELEELTCTADIREWAAGKITELQAAVDHVIACVNNAALPEMSICTLKDDLIGCPLGIEMVDFSGGTYGEGGVGELPQPAQVGGFEFRTGLKQSGCVACDAWKLDTVVFDTPFPHECVHVDVSVDKAQDSDCGGVAGTGANVMKIYEPLVRSLSATGFSVYFCGDDFGAKRKLTYRYLAAGN